MEVREGKFWGVAHDLHALGVELHGGVPWVGPYTARFDRVFYSKVCPLVTDLVRMMVFTQRICSVSW